MTSRGAFALIVCAFLAAFGASAALYSRSRSADFDRHSQAIEALGRVGNIDRGLSRQVLAARFGLLNQYDSLNATQLALEAADRELSPRIRGVMPIDAELGRSLDELRGSIEVKRAAGERFKTENAVLRNSTYYLPTAANELGPKTGVTAYVAVQRVAQTGLAYNLIGDDSARRAHLQALAELRAQEAAVSDDLRSSFRLLVAHADVIAREVPAVDGWVSKVGSSDTSDKLAAVERAYLGRFDEIVTESNRYRRILYGWSLVLLVSVGLAGLQLRRVYAGLELRVTERTAELRRALAALWGEMKLARKIQEALVPALPSLPGCEIAARMQPTDEVGGDYYDVIDMPDCTWILIGDVSGHGVPAGLIMMMCHTAIRTVLRCDPDVGPDTLLARVNTVLTRNIRQLGEDKYMTISAFRRSADGTVRFAGAHQDVQIYRSATGAVESLETSGLWLGLKEEIGQALAVQEFRLHKGDLLLLHTDGVTEAVHDGVMFEPAGLRRILGAVGAGSARDIVAEVFDALEGFQVTDDATVVAIKQL